MATKKFSTKLIAAALLGLGMAGAAGASVTFTFQPCGSAACTITGAAAIDWSPGNALGIDGAGGGSLLPLGTKVTDLFQANLSVVQDGGGGNLFSNGSSSDGSNRFFTVVAGFGEVVSALSGGSTNQFVLDPANPTNFFKIYANTSALGNNLAGTGFTAGTEILSGIVTFVDASVTVGAASVGPGGSIITCGLFDQFLGDSYGGKTTICTTGGANVTAVVMSADTDYFPDLISGAIITAAFTTNNLNTPFNSVNPSAAFSSDGVADGDTLSDIGSMNGISGPNFQFLADANTSFDRVPEPGTLALLGIALAGIAAANRRRRKQ